VQKKSPKRGLPEKYTAQRIAEFLLSNAISDMDYGKMREEVCQLGIDPDSIPHHKPV
jgi:hypothetical protein